MYKPTTEQVRERAESTGFGLNVARKELVKEFYLGKLDEFRWMPQTEKDHTVVSILKFLLERV